MSSFSKLQKALEKKTLNNSYDNNLKNILNSKEITEYSIKECFEKASILLQKDPENLDYVIIQKGTRGLLGIGKKPYIIRFMSKQIITKKDNYKSNYKDEKKKIISENKKIENENGTLQFAMKYEGAFIKITSPKGKGKAITLKKVTHLIKSKGLKEYDQNLINKLVNSPSNKWEKIGEYIEFQEYNSKIIIKKSQNMLKAYINITEPIMLGRTLDKKEVFEQLKQEAISYGIKKEVVTNILDQSLYNKDFIIAEGNAPINGVNAKIEFLFNTKTDFLLQEDKSGKVDFFSDLGLIQNARENQTLAIKHNYTEGSDGKSITGEIIPCNPGKDIEIKTGKNVKILEEEEKIKVIAEKDGRISYKNNTISIEEIYNIKGNIGIETGSINFTGDVKVNGSIEDGFSVNTLGNIYVGGTIGKCKIKTKGDIIVKGGIVGKDEAKIESESNILAKFIQNANVIAENKIIAPEGILYSQVQSKYVYCLGKRGTINGGKIQSLKEINAKVLGSASYNETILESGFDQKTSKKLKDLESKYQSITSNIKQIESEINKVNPSRLQKKDLNKKQILTIENFKKAQREFTVKLDFINDEIYKLRLYFTNIASKASISGQDKIYPGCEIIIKNAILKIKKEYNFSRFTQDTVKRIKTSDYKEPENLNKEQNKK